jgi:hypothetical protein
MLAEPLAVKFAEVDIIACVIRFRGAPAPTGGHGEDASDGDSGHEGDQAVSD